MNTKHTPGPWKQHLVDEMTVIDAAGNHICDTSPLGYGDDDDIAFNTDSERCEANARLIAAAPDMYEALLDIISDRDCLSEATINLARAAIAKAEGRYD